MFWNKKDKHLPDLPQLPTSHIPLKFDDEETDIDEGEEEDITPEHSLPSFPDSPMKKGFSQAAIKDAIGSQEMDTDKKFETIEMDTPSQGLIEPPPIIEKRPINLPKSDIFVKIDKFRSARQSLEEIKLRVDEISELLKKVREIKLREEQELSSWEKEVSEIKTKLQDITENIFEKAE